MPNSEPALLKGRPHLFIKDGNRWILTEELALSHKNGRVITPPTSTVFDIPILASQNAVHMSKD